MNGVIYCRVSSKEQVEGTSLESQEVACRDYANRHQINIAKIFVERGESAKFADRTQLLELMEFCRHKENAVRVLLVWKIDRLARNVGDHFNIKASLLKQNVNVVSVTEPIDTNPEGKLLETILAGFAQFDNDLRATRTVQGMRKKIQDGIFPWKPPLGYRTLTQAGSKKTEPDQPEQPLFAILRTVWNDFATGAYTKAEILRIASSRGVRTRAGMPLTKQSLDNMLKDPFYAGVIRDPWSGADFTGGHLPLVSREVFVKIQGIIARRAKTERHERVRVEFPLRMFARCAECNHYMTGGFSRGRSKRYGYYHCFKKSCENPMYHRADAAHREFAIFLQSITPTKLEFEQLADEVARVIRDRSHRLSELAERRKRDAQKIADQQQQLIKMRIERLITEDEFLVHRTELNKHQREIENLPNGVASEQALLASLDAICDPILRLSETWEKLQPGFQQRFQRSILPAGFAIGRIRTADMSCLFSFLQRSREKKSHLVPPMGHFWNQLRTELAGLTALLRKENDSVAA